VSADWTFRTITGEPFANRAARRQWRASITKKFPYHIDLVPPAGHTLQAFEDALVEHLTPLKDKIEMYTDQVGPVAFVRYFFKDAADATTFREKFAIYVATPAVKPS
jgi:hypothetical protein